MARRSPLYFGVKPNRVKYPAKETGIICKKGSDAIFELGGIVFLFCLLNG